MAVLTPLSEPQLRNFVACYALGDLEKWEGIAAGSVNTNYRLQIAAKPYFLRVYEERDRSGAEQESVLLARLAATGVPTPAPIAAVNGATIQVLAGKPAAIFPWRDGEMRCQASVTPAHTERLGRALAMVHTTLATADANRFGPRELRIRLEAISKAVPAELAANAAVLGSRLDALEKARNSDVPRGVIHGDLFRDNVLWSDADEVSALLDFESASEGPFVFDLAVCLLSWCYGDDFEPALIAAMIRGYESVRPLTEEESAALYVEAQFAALRFSVTRITDYAMRVTEGPRVIKDYRRFLARLTRLEEMGAEGFAGWLRPMASSALGLKWR